MTTCDSSDEEDICRSEFSSEDDEACTLLLNKDLVPKLTNRKTNKCEAKWIYEGRFAGMAEVTKFRGKYMKSMGINRDSRVLLYIEEIGYLLQREALTVLDGGFSMTVIDIYSKIMMGAFGCTWEGFKVYLELKNLGYIIRRHNVLWSTSLPKSRVPEKSPQHLKDELPTHFAELEIEDECCANAIRCADICANTPSDSKQSIRGGLVPQNTISDDCDDILKRLDTSIRLCSLMFDVFPPNCNFKKTAPGTPDFSLCISSHVVPDRDALEVLNSQNDGIPVRVAIVDSGRVTFFEFDDVQLPILS